MHRQLYTNSGGANGSPDIESVLNYVLFLKEGNIIRQGDVDDIREEKGMSIDQLFREEFRC